MLEGRVPNGKGHKTNAGGISPFSIFSYVWAGQSLVQLAFFRQWLEQGLVLGWVFFLLSTAVFVFPGRTRLFIAMLASGLLYYFSLWPFVSNHIIADSIVSFAIVISFFIAFRNRLTLTSPIDRSAIDQWLQKFGPVVGATFIFIYVSIIISKLNDSFFDLEISCLTGMIQDAEASRPMIAPFLSFASTEFFHWFFIVVEIALPMMLLLRKTRLAAFYFGIPFHIVLGLMGHWSFSAFMIALYVLVCLPSLTTTINEVAKKWTIFRIERFPQVPTIAVFTIVNGLILLTAILGKPSITWLAWTLLLSSAIMYGVLREHLENGLFSGSGVTAFWVKSPGIVWLVFAVALINSSGPYLGWKTQTSIAMYSNMRTEGDVNNHFFIPKVPLFRLQDDLIEIIDSNNDEVLALKTHTPTYGYDTEKFEVYLVYFEFRRFVSRLEDEDLEINYLRNGEKRTFRRGADTNIDADLDTRPGFLLHKLLYFRPVFKGDYSYCLH